MTCMEASLLGTLLFTTCAQDGSERTFANITMILSDPTSPSCGKCVELQLSSMEGHPEFLCLQGRYDLLGNAGLFFEMK